MVCQERKKRHECTKKLGCERWVFEPLVLCGLPRRLACCFREGCDVTLHPPLLPLSGIWVSGEPVYSGLIIQIKCVQDAFPSARDSVPARGIGVSGTMVA